MNLINCLWYEKKIYKIEDIFVCLGKWWTRNFQDLEKEIIYLNGVEKATKVVVQVFITDEKEIKEIDTQKMKGILL